MTKTKKAKSFFALIFISVILIIVSVLFIYEMKHRGMAPYDTPDASNMPSAEEIIPKFDKKYILRKMNENELSDLCAVYCAAVKFEEKAVLPYRLDKSRVAKIFELLNCECPELFQIDYSKDISYVYDISSGKVMSVSLNYRMDKSEYSEQYEKVLKRIKEICVGVSQSGDGSDYSKELYVYETLANGCVYSAEGKNVSTPYGVLCEKKGKCDGISLAFKWIAEELGMECFVLTGHPEGDGAGHAWNTVNIDGIYADVDLTADMIYEDEQDHILSYFGFNVPSDNGMRERYEMSEIFTEFSVPHGKTLNQNYNYKNGNFIEKGVGREFFENSLNKILYEGGGVIRMQYFDPSEYEYMKSELENIISDICGNGKDAPYVLFEYSYSVSDDYKGILFKANVL